LGVSLYFLLRARDQLDVVESMERGEFPPARDELPWWRRERTKDLAVGFVLGFLSAGVAGWLAEKFGL
jgi:hypothetical protein